MGGKLTVLLMPVGVLLIVLALATPSLAEEGDSELFEELKTLNRGLRSADAKKKGEPNIKKRQPNRRKGKKTREPGQRRSKKNNKKNKVQPKRRRAKKNNKKNKGQTKRRRA